MNEKRDVCLVCAIICDAIAIIFLLIRLGGGPALWLAGWVALGFFLLAGVFVIAVLVYDYREVKNPLFGWSPDRKYNNLKSRTARSLRKKKAEDGLTQNDIQKAKAAFIVSAQRLDIDPVKAQDDFEMEIRKRVMK